MRKGKEVRRSEWVAFKVNKTGWAPVTGSAIDKVVLFYTVHNKVHVHIPTYFTLPTCTQYYLSSTC